MTIIYETNKMTTMMANDAVIDECYDVATSAMGFANEEWKNIWKKVYRDKFDLYAVLARDDAASDKLVGMFCFGDISQYEVLTRDRHSWANDMRDAIIAKGIEEAKVDAASAIYVHADYTGQSIATTMMGKRASYQIARGVTHAVSFAYESDDMKAWSAGRTGAEALGLDGAGNQIYLFDLSRLAL